MCLGYKEYERGMCLQMIGRAGRPQFDTEGVAVIMTQRQARHPQRAKAPITQCAMQNIQRYENLAMGCEELESQLKTCFAEYLNAEIVLGTIKNMPLAVEWLKSTFMYIRVRYLPLYPFSHFASPGYAKPSAVRYTDRHFITARVRQDHDGEVSAGQSTDSATARNGLCT